MSTVTVDTLLGDIMRTLEEAAAGDGPISLNPEAEKFFNEGMASVLKKAVLGKGKRKREPNVLYVSEIGHPCLRKLWYKVRPDMFTATAINGKGLFKFLYGDLIEVLVLTLAIQAGHKVEMCQHPIEFPVGTTGWKVRGRLDAVIDGVLVDVKSASSISMQKFHDIEKLMADDAFGYIMQLLTYHSNLTGVSDECGFLAVDKVDGTMVMPILKPDGPVPDHVYEHIVSVVSSNTIPPVDASLQPYEIKTLPGYKKLKSTCSYCDYRDECWKHANKGKGIKWVKKGSTNHATVGET